MPYSRLDPTNRGIGRAIAEEALARGAKKLYAAARNVDGVADLAEQHSARVIPRKLDITDPKDVDAAAARATDVQLLVNNAGVAGFSGFVYNHEPDTARKEMETNYFGPLCLTRAFAASIVANGRAVVNVISVGGLSNFPPADTYSASKAATHSLTQGLRAELTPQRLCQGSNRNLIQLAFLPGAEPQFDPARTARPPLTLLRVATLPATIPFRPGLHGDRHFGVGANPASGTN